jgi:hypothetical protein
MMNNQISGLALESDYIDGNVTNVRDHLRLR